MFPTSLEQIPATGQSLELERSALSEFEPRTSDKISDDTGNQHFIGTGLSHDARGGVHSNAADIIAPDLDLPSVQPSAHWKADLLCCGAKCKRTAYRSTRTVEGCKNAIAGTLHEIAAMPIDYMSR